MSQGAEEKEQRRQERLAAEHAARRKAERGKRIGLVGGVALVAAIVVIAVVAIGSGGDDGGEGAPEDAGAAVPAQRIDNLAEAARAARCEVTEHRVEGRGHTTAKVRYRTNPPTSGEHAPTPAQDGIYAPDNPPDVEQEVHALEHGRLLIQYKPGTPPQRIAQLETMFNEELKGEPGYHTLLFQNQTDMEPAVAVTAWGYSLTCDAWNDRVFDAIRAFRRDRVDKGPEFVP